MVRRLLLPTLLLLALISIGCSSGRLSPVLPSPATPGLTGAASQHAGQGSKALWGVWEVTIDPTTFQISVVPRRGIEYTVDVVAFLQLPKGKPANLQIHVTDITKFHMEGILGVDVGLTHPFPGLNQFVGFDVMGVFMGSGSLVSKSDSSVLYSNGAVDPILLNPDGYTRWFNPTEFAPDGTIMRFIPGNLGEKNLGLINATINGYKYFADGLAADQTVLGFFQAPGNVDKRGDFLPGSFNHRNYLLKFPLVGGAPKLTFQYAVVANWVQSDKALSGDPDVLDIPGDYPPSANSPESFFCNVIDSSNLYYTPTSAGGDLILNLEVFDWAGFFNPGSIPGEIATVTLESQNSLIPGGVVTFPGASLIAAPGSTDVSSVFTVEVDGGMPTSTEGQEVLISIQKTHGGFTPNPDLPPVVSTPLTSYVRFTAHVMGEPPGPDFKVIDPNGGETLWMALSHEIKWSPGTSGIANVALEWSPDDFVSDIRTLADNIPNTGSFLWKPIPNFDTTTAKVRVRDVLGTLSDTSDNFFTIALPVWLDFQPEVLVTDSDIDWTVPVGSVAYDQSWDEFSPALAQDLDGLVHVCWHREKAFPDADPPHREDCDTGIRSTDGISWGGEGGFFFTWGGNPDPDPINALRGDYMKLAPASNDTTFAAIRHWGIYFSVDVDHFPNNHMYYNAYTLFNRTFLNQEILADDTYLYTVSDGDINLGDGPGIYSYRCKTPDPVWPGWPESTDPIPTLNILTNNGEVSHSRSWAIYGGNLVLAYYTVSSEIKLLKQTDKAADTWDDTEVIFDGTGYTGCTDPSIAVDGKGRLMAIWTGKEDTSGEYRILASMQETPGGVWTPPIVVEVSPSAFDELHVSTSADPVLLPTGDSEYMVLIGYELDQTVYAQISPKDLWAFLPAQFVSTSGGGQLSTDPDTLCLKSPYTYDSLFTWNFEVTPGTIGWGDRDIKFRNADFKTP